MCVLRSTDVLCAIPLSVCVWFVDLCDDAWRWPWPMDGIVIERNYGAPRSANRR